MKKSYTTLAVRLVLAVVVVVAIWMLRQPEGGRNSDLLSNIKSRAYILVATDSDYAPQSFFDTEGLRTAGTKCPTNAYTTSEMQGFDVDVAGELGRRLGVETCFTTPNWDVITGGHWADKWDISVGSMTITRQRETLLLFSAPYYYLPAVVAVTNESGLASFDQLSGKGLCVAASTYAEDWLRGALDLPPEDIYAKAPPNVTVVPLNTDQECARAMQKGQTDFVGFVAAPGMVSASIAAGLPVNQIGGPIYAENLAAAFDRASRLDTASFRAAIDRYIQAIHADGTLSTLSTKWFQADLTQTPAP